MSQDKKIEVITRNKPENKLMDPTDSSNPNSHSEATLSLVLESPQIH